MTRNLGGFERIARLVIAGIILGLYGALPSPWRYITLVGLIPLASALTGFCPIYVQMGWNRRQPTAHRSNS
ncbi:MAG: hypothetical protein QOH59_2520 [Gemmatimonadales bacterium]|jgi:hypothetical protein|nr:hypothetical protein [Gemmatimonadales bacterium]